jgi:hypothetical protein
LPQIKCPGCDAGLRVSEEHEGRRGVCPCGHRFRISFESSLGYALKVEPKPRSEKSALADATTPQGESFDDDASVEQLTAAPDLTDASFVVRAREWISERSKLELLIAADGAAGLFLGIFLTMCLFKLGATNAGLAVGWTSPFDSPGLSEIIPLANNGMRFGLPSQTVAFSALFAFSVPFVALGLILGRHAEFIDWAKLIAIVLILGLPLMATTTSFFAQLFIALAGLLQILSGFAAGTIEQWKVRKSMQATRWIIFVTSSAVAGTALVLAATINVPPFRMWSSSPIGRTSVPISIILLVVLLYVRGTVGFFTHTWYLNHSRNNYHREVVTPAYKSFMLTSIGIAGLGTVLFCRSEWFFTISLEAAMLISVAGSVGIARRLIA